jgi:23S rRNA G2445 N2-methylase RlmL
MKITLIATTKFGLEMIVKQEVQALGFDEIVVSDGRIEFEATWQTSPKPISGCAPPTACC